jgi:hypothetical protein
MQCAWCRRPYDEGGVTAEALPLLLEEASHGLCPECLAEQLALERQRHALKHPRLTVRLARRAQLCALLRRARSRQDHLTRRAVALLRRVRLLLIRQELQQYRLRQQHGQNLLTLTRRASRP